jgi:hypothetical protein
LSDDAHSGILFALIPVGLTVKAAAFLCAIMLGAAGHALAAKVYKWTDERGNVIYSDTPRPGAVELDVPTEPAGIVPVPPEKMPVPKPPAAGEAVASYGSLIIAAPSNDQVVEDRGSGVSVSLALEPALQVDKGHAIRLRLDGQALAARYTAGEITIPSIERGTHILEAQIVDPSEVVLIASAPVTFTVQAPSSQAPTGPDIYEPVYPPQPYPPTYPPVYPPRPLPAPRPQP